jgi:hypothetical protein
VRWPIGISSRPCAGEGAPFTGLKPAGVDVGPIIPIAEKAIESMLLTMIRS